MVEQYFRSINEFSHLQIKINYKSKLITKKIFKKSDLNQKTPQQAEGFFFFGWLMVIIL